VGVGDYVETLLKRSDIEVNFLGEECRTTLCLAVMQRSGHTPIVMTLLADPRFAAATKDIHGLIPLSYAGTVLAYEIMTLLLDCDHVDVNSVDYNGITLLAHFVQHYGVKLRMARLQNHLQRTRDTDTLYKYCSRVVNALQTSRTKTQWIGCGRQFTSTKISQNC
jgi:hypothetical protein